MESTRQIKLVPFEPVRDKVYADEVIFIINKQNFSGITIDENHITFFFENCLFLKDLKIENPDKIELDIISIHFSGCYIEHIEIEKIEDKNINISFFSSFLSGRINNNNITHVSVNNCICKNIFLLNQSNIDISFTEENVFPRIWLKLFSKIGVDDILDAIKLKQSYYLYDSKNITFKTNTKEHPKEGIYSLDNRHIKDYRLNYSFNDKQKNLFDINLSIKYSQENPNIKTNISSSFLKSLEISGYCDGLLNIESTKIDEFYISELFILKEASLYDIKPLSKKSDKSKFSIYKSNLENTWFDNVDFDEYSIISFYRTKLGKAMFTSCTFPKDATSFEKFNSLQNVHYPDKRTENYYKDQYEIFLQLKRILESGGNTYESQKMQAISNDSLIKIKQISRWDKFILYINSFSNNHGLSIKRPLFYFIFFTFLFYILYLWSINRMFNTNGIDYKLFGYYFSFIDITHRSDFLVDKDKFNACSLIIDFLNKIVSGFFIYQFISAFRKYGKK